jgi:hypothetical protein
MMITEIVVFWVVTVHRALTQNSTYDTMAMQLWLARDTTQLTASNSSLRTEGNDDKLTVGRYNMVMTHHAMSFHSVINISPLKASLIALYTVLLAYINM